MEKSDLTYVAGPTGLVGSAIIRSLNQSGFHNLLLRKHAGLNLTCLHTFQEIFREYRSDYVFLDPARVGDILAN